MQTALTAAATVSMTVDEARTVYWLRNNHRPLGELLDQGYLNEQRLAWAADHAYDVRLKAAAAVLLEHVRSPEASAPRVPPQAQPLEMKVTETRARTTLWPFPPHKNRPMGELSDTHQLSLKDLGYAIDNAWDPRVRDAAMLLMAQRLQQAVVEPRGTGGPPVVISGGRSFSQRRELLWVMVLGVLAGWYIIACIAGIYFSIRSLASTVSNPMPEVFANPTPSTLVGIGIGLVILVVIYWSVRKGLDAVVAAVEGQIHAYRRGHEGEQRVLEAVRQNLDGAWTLFCNVELPIRRAGDIDMVLAGPSGVWILEVKNFTGDYRNYGEHWDYRAGTRWKPMGKGSPSRQAAKNAAQLSSFLKADGLRQYIDPAVVWANPETVPEIDQPTVPVWTRDRLPDELSNLDRGRRVDEATQTRIVEKLTALCARQANGNKEAGHAQ